MGKNAARLLFLSAMLVALAGCSSWTGKKADDVDPNLFPADYKKEILNTLIRLLDDPTNVHDAGIADPELRPVGQDQRYAVCVRANVRNANRHYTGVTDRIAYFYGGHLNQLVEDKDGLCAKAVYKPWPELANFCLTKKCT
jgi:hypothetical protein